LARQYGYLYQQSDKEYVILHDLNGYDEISLTGPFKIFSNLGEDQLEPADLNLPVVTSSSISGGGTVEEAAKIFMQILEGNGTQQQNAVVIANAGMALYCGNKEAGIKENINKAEKALMSGAALSVFKKLMS